MKKLFLLILLPFFISGEPVYQVKLVNGLQTSERTFQFDVVINAPIEFELTAYQCSFKFNEQMGDSLSFTYKQGSSQLTNPPAFAIGIHDDISVRKLAFASGPGSDLIKDEKRIGTFILSSIQPFRAVLPNISWAFSDIHNIRTLFTGSSFQDITNWTYFSDLFYDIPLPVELINFRVISLADSVQLSWETITEINTTIFVIVRDGEKAGFIPAAGNSNSVKYYQFFDKPSSGTHKYFVETQNQDGTFERSDTIEISYQEKLPIDVGNKYWWFIIAGIILIVFVIYFFVIGNKKSVPQS